MTIKPYTPNERGQLRTAKYHSPAEIDQRDRVNPQNGHGKPVTHRKVHFMKGRVWKATQIGKNNPKPVNRAMGKCATTTSQ